MPREGSLIAKNIISRGRAHSN